MSDDTGILLFLAAGVLVLALIVVFGVLSSRRKKTATAHTWTVRTGWIGEQWLTITDEQGERAEHEVHVSRIGHSLRAGFPQAKVGLTAYFREWEGTEFPVAFAVKGSDKIVELAMDAEGVTARDSAGVSVFASPWSTLLFSNGPDIVLAGGTGKTVRVEYKDGDTLEELLIKYGTLKQMHF